MWLSSLIIQVITSQSVLSASSHLPHTHQYIFSLLNRKTVWDFNTGAKYIQLLFFTCVRMPAKEKYTLGPAQQVYVIRKIGQDMGIWVYILDGVSCFPIFGGHTVYRQQQ